ncbi:extracellular solute-binding protein [Thalassomonas viridans]|uniref:Extracellular solute-binding protein n=1 Tax=Thalassomonas viridans TaxID=137584 RepID=A0AAF0CCF2_9GAMM|nr:extracellular solute-binding protein [Thalassomonas viridans]WDE08056.1 extracellular solute-binding protein [Thalassomonas viridans]
MKFSFPCFITLTVVLGFMLPAKSLAGTSEPVIVYAVTDGIARELAHAFSKKAGVRVEIINTGGSGQTLRKIEAEAYMPLGDVWFGGSLGAHAQGSYQGLIQAYRPRDFEQLTAKFSDPLGDNRVTGIYTGILGFVIRTDLLAEKKLPIPTGWQDLLKEEYRGLIHMKSPLTSGTAYTTLLTLISLMGEDQAFSYLAKLHKNIRQYTTYRGAVTITFIHEAVGHKQQQIVIPAEGTGYEIGGLSLIKNGPTPDGAKAFIDYVISLEGQLIAAQSQENFQFSSHSQVPPRKEIARYQTSRLQEIDFQWAGRHRERLVQRWQREIQGLQVTHPAQ